MATTGTSIVYLATNTANGKRYVGASKHGLKVRKPEHFKLAKRGAGYIFHKAIRKYGESAFIFEILGTFDNHADALAFEVVSIALLRPEYNLTSGGEGVSREWTDAQRERMRQIKLANPSRPMLGKKHSAEAIEKIKRTKKAAVPPAICLDALARHHQRAIELSAQKRRKTVICLNDGAIFGSAKEAGEFYGMTNHRALYHAIERGSQMRNTGLSFAYEEAQ